MNLSKRFLVVGVFLLVSSSAGLVKSQDHNRRIAIEADYAIFRTDGGKRAYLEIAYAIPCKPLTYVAAGADSLVADLLMRVNISRGDSLWAADLWRTSHKLAAKDSISGRRIVNVLRFPIQSGAYVAKLFARDVRSALASDSLVLIIEHKNFSSDEPAISEMQLASSISSEKASAEDAFHKNSYRVVPNPSAIFGGETPTLFYYLETYNLLKRLPGPTYRTRCYLADAGRVALPNFKSREQVKPLMASSVEVGAFNVNSLLSGTYFLQFDVLDADGAPIQSAVKRLFVYNPQIEATPSEATDDAGTQVFAGVADEEISRESEYVKYLCNEAERIIARKLASAQAKREFLLQFWKRQERETTLPWIELRRRYLQAVASANESFKSFAGEGWRSDRGRVYLLYGKPDDVERFPSPDDSKPYEVWTYNGIEGGVEFFFGDRSGFKDYHLLHSTKLGEIKNENWRDLLTTRR